MGIYETLQERGLIAQMTHADEIREALNNSRITFYTGYDATADSLHVGHFLQLVVMRHLQLAGHRPIVVLGTGTTMVGDPSFKDTMRKMMTVEQIDYNAECFRKQMSKFLDFSEGQAFFVRNGDWLRELKYIDFLRDVGIHFSVNKMLAADCFRTRMERDTGLNFLEFNYMLMQSYDFLHLFRKYGCQMQLGGNDQWSNILSGADLIRRVEHKPAWGMTFTLLTTKDGRKMGKTEAGAVWLDPNKTSPYEFFQYWRNVDDADVINCLKLLTFLPMEEIRKMESWQGGEINRAKEILAYELTRMVHSEEDANKALDAARAIFSAGGISDDMPTTKLEDVSEGIAILDLLMATSLAPSKGEARRLIQQGGISVDDEKITDVYQVIPASSFEKGHVIIRKGKKIFHKATV